MHFNADEGGEVLHAIGDVAAARTSMQTAVNSLTASGFTPISETLYEAYRYMTGGLVEYGTGGVAEARDPANGGRYNSPIDSSCQ
jgi:type IV pilus assembly protein PilY1